ncbi:MAG: SAM-dependent methyltransferase [Janthinobacterium lividum]
MESLGGAPRQAAIVDHFEQMFEKNDDPWHYRRRWYEQRKRALTLAMLPLAHYRRAFEPACANGELTAALADRCDALLSCDASANAVRLARQRLAGQAHVVVEQRILPEDWPDGRFDLIVISEFAYYLPSTALARLLELACAALTDGGTLLACHWRWPIEEWAGPVDSIHRLIGMQPGLHRLAHHEETDMLLDVWSTDPRSVAQMEGLV